MIIKIHDDKYTAVIDSIGAELKSFCDCNNGDEMIWQADAAVWNGSAPILFPVIGRTKNDHYVWRNRSWKMPKHGLVRKQKWALLRQSDSELVFRISDNEFSRQYYPANFIFDAGFALIASALKISYQITNTGTDEMLFSVGSHPGINLPMDGTRLEDYYLIFNRQENCAVHRLLPTGLLAVKPERILCGEVRIPLTMELFQDDALFILGLASDEIRVCNDRTGRIIRVRTGGAPDLGLWAKPGAAYVCIEPWFGYDDMDNHDGILEHKTGIIHLQPREIFATGYEISL